MADRGRSTRIVAIGLAICVGFIVVSTGCSKSEPDSDSDKKSDIKPASSIEQSTEQSAEQTVEQSVNPYVNVQEIDPGKAYRCRQLPPKGLAWAIDQYKIKTVLNLRGPNPEKSWYQNEEKVCRDKNVSLISVPMSSQRMPKPEELQAIIEALRESPKPLLIHCESGIDRTGAVAGLYHLDALQQDRSTALEELSLAHGHIRALKPCMTTLVELYESSPEWFAQYQQTFDTIECKIEYKSEPTAATSPTSSMSLPSSTPTTN